MDAAAHGKEHLQVHLVACLLARLLFDVMEVRAEASHNAGEARCSRLAVCWRHTLRTMTVS